MKKALVILMALSMVFAAFADEPAVKNEIAEFTGNASVTWGVDLDAGKTGFKNAEEAKLKFTLFGSGDKSTTGDGIWGEIKIKFDDGVDYTAGTTDNFNGKAAAVDFAKIHLSDMLAIGIREGSNKYGEYKPTLAVFSDNGHIKTDNVGGTVTDGITLEVKLPDLLDLNIDFRSVEQYTNKYGIGASLAVKAVENLNLKVGFGIDFDPMVWGLSASADYKLGLSDTMYLKPQVGFTMKDTANSGKIAAALLFGWGSENQDTNIKWVSKKVSDGFSVATEIELKDNAAIPLCVGVWDSTFVENLKVGAQFHVKDLINNFKINTLAFEFAYDLGGIKPAVAFAIDDDGDLGLNATKLYVGIDFTGFVANTTFSLAYESGNLKASANKLGTVNVTAKISF